MALRKALAYSKKYARPYTRVSRNKAKAYIKVSPQNKIAKYNSGDFASFRDGKFPFQLTLISVVRAQIRDNALEAARQFLVKMLDEKAFGQYYLELKVHPHHLLRNNKTAAGAGADRMSSGMKHSFGIIEGRAAMVPPGKSIYFIACANDASTRVAREALGMIKSKIPGKTAIRFVKV
ncbi:MAG: 50S ribosomal protein L16 [Nanoarchaeota archaeon]